jgi:hypothetical protein
MLLIDARRPEEIKAIRQLCEIYKVNASWADDPNCDLLEFGKRLRFVQSVRAVFGLDARNV